MANQFLTNGESTETVVTAGDSGGWWPPAESAWLGTSPFPHPATNQVRDLRASVSPAPHRRHGQPGGSVAADSFERYY